MIAGTVIDCLKCRRPTRPPRALAGDYPGTVPRVGEHCKTCHEAREQVANPEPRMTCEENRATLAAYLRARRRREETMLRQEFATTYPHIVKESA